MTTDRLSGSALVIFSLSGDLGEPCSAARDISPAGTGLHSDSAGIAAANLRNLPRSDRWPVGAFVFDSLVEWRHALAIFAACIFAALGIERLGYRLTVVLVLGFLLKVVERRGWRGTIGLALGLAFGSFYLFHTLLRVPLPLGSLGF